MRNIILLYLTLIVTVAIPLVLLSAGCSVSMPSTQPSTRPTSSQAVIDDILQAGARGMTSIGAALATDAAMRKVSTVDRPAVGNAVYGIASDLAQSLNTSQPVNASGIKQLLADRISKDARLTPYSALINAEVAIIVDGLARTVPLTDPKARPYELAALNGVMAATARYR